ncbi:hypothetical protein KR032_012506, partial [Drosophila birchii]
WRFPASQELLRDFYLLQVEGRFKDSNYAARCYLKVEMGTVEAVISGGRRRRSSYKDNLWMNGSMSYDFSKSPSEKQFSTYIWDCESEDDKDNQFCHRNISSGEIFLQNGGYIIATIFFLEAAFSIPANSLKKGCTYVFELQVSRDNNPRISSQIYQFVTIIVRRVLQVKIECLRNCKKDFYIPNSRVHLKAVCINCGKQNVARRWFIDGQKMFSTKEIIIHIRAAANKTQIKLSMMAEDGRHGRDIKSLLRNFGPTGGKCSVSPGEGQEAITNFVPCCQRFVTKNPPIEYFYYAGTVLLGSCLDCSCGIRLPATSSLSVLACDFLFACHSSWIKVKVAPLVVIPTKPTDLQLYMSGPRNSIVRLLEEGLLSSYLQALNAIGSHISLADSAIILLNGFRDIQPYTQSSLSKLANLTLTLAHRLPTSNPKTQALLIMLVRKLTDNFQEVISNEDAKDLTQRPMIDITLACLKVYRLMQELAEKIPRPPPFIYDRYHQAFLRGSLDQDLVDELYLEMPKMRTSLWNWLNWLNFSWETDRFGVLMNRVRPNKNLFQNKLPPPKLSIVDKCFKIRPKDVLVVNTTDHMHTVILSRRLFNEVLREVRKNLCFKITSVQRLLNWWYPDEKRPSSRLLSVRLLDKRGKRYSTDFRLKRSHLKYTANMTISIIPEPNDIHEMGDSLSDLEAVSMDAPSDVHTGRYIRVVRHGRLKTLQTVRLYRVILDEQTVMAVHFIRSTHKLQVKMKLEVKPLWREISSSRCVVPALATNKTILIRNNCIRQKRAYMALRVWSNVPIRDSPNTSLPGGPAEYTFAFQIRSCATWVENNAPDRRVWTQVGCSPTMDISVVKELQCTCDVLGIYTSYVHYTPPIKVSVGTFTKPTINRLMIYFYTALLLFILFSIYWLFRYSNDLPSKTILYRMADDDGVKDDELHDLLIKFHTGGRVNSQTTASVTLVLLTTKQIIRKVKVPQDPEKIIFKRNSTINVWLRSREIRLPTKLMVYHDNSGRNPSWYLRKIELNDIQTHETQVFIVKKWITGKVLILNSSHLFRTGEILELENWRKRFKLHMEMLCINWALWQPLIGSWRENSHFKCISRAKRVCVFVSKTVIAYTCCALYFKTTTIESLQLDRDCFFDSKDLIAIVLFVTAIDAVFQLMFKLIAKHVS